MTIPTESLVDPQPLATGPETTSPSPSEDSRWAELLTPHYLATTVMLCIGVALFAFNSFLVTTVLPTAVMEIGGGELLSWSITLYLLGSILGGMSAALLKARFGARDALLAAGLLFLIGTMIAAFAESMDQVLAGRVAQGLGEGVVAALCYALIPELYPSRLVPKVFGAEAAVWAIASFGGPLGAGFITETVSWRAAFLVNAPIILLFLLLTLRIAPTQRAVTNSKGLPLLRLLLLSLGMLSLLMAGLFERPALTFAAVLLAILLMAGSIRLDRFSMTRLLPTGAFGFSSTVGLGLWVVLLMPVAQATSSVYLVFSLQHLLGYGPTLAGGLGAVMAMSWSVAAVTIANLKHRNQRRLAIQFGPLLQLLGILTLASGIFMREIGLIVLGQITIGAAFGVSWGYLSQMLMDVTPDAERDKTSALLPTLQSAGFAIGAAIAGLIANTAGFDAKADADHLHDILTLTFIVPLVWAIPASLCAYLAVKRAPEPWR
ncbi:MFS transporter [Peteryoungia desertarenae]|uniref:MFS transporter n=1 Tax=Peteryoungia desertarenae TaxID=1813451 RepID=A0ABX6QN30_9HYPH|nr:MFS transporter [Peteryoungia desertarenae]QLF69647.1 MFS transporter [Peteryoungia desertarenae]